MKSLSFCIALTLACIVFFVINNQEPKSEIIQYHKTVNKPIDGPIKQIVLKTNSVNQKKIPNKLIFNIKPNIPERKRFVNKAPVKTIEVLKMETALIEEQGADVEYAALVYYEYGDVLVDSELYEQAIEAFEKADKYGFKDLKTLYFKIARAYALNGKYYGAMEDYLVKARENGFRNYRALFYDKAFKNWNNEYEFMYLYHELFGSNKKAMFKALTILAPKKKLTKAFFINPVALFENTGYKYRKENGYYETKPLISGYFNDFVDGVGSSMFSREAGDEYRFEMMLANNNNYVALIYSKEETWSEYILPKKYRLITFDRVGNKISELEIAKRGSLTKCKGFVLHPDKTLEVSNYSIEWKDGTKSRTETDQTFLMHTDLKIAEATDTKTYMISDNGRIVESDGILLSMN